MKNISITVENKRATVVGSPVIVCGNSDYTVTFAFDDEWSLTGPKTARFVYVKRGKVEHEDVVFEGNTVAVPVLSDVAFVNVGVFAGDLCTTTPARVNCKASILCSSGAVHEPTPDVYSQIMALINRLIEQGSSGATEEQVRQIEQNSQGIKDLQEGNTQAGDALKLDGHGADYFVPTETFEDHKHSVEDIEDFAHKHSVKDIEDFPDSMPASDVPDWAKAENKPTYSYEEIQNPPTIPAAIAVKGNAESAYRTGNVNLTPANIGALAASGGTVGGNLAVTGTLTTGGHAVLHDGNSAKVHIGTSAPSDTSSLWIDTSE